ncbi:hypothetical protein DFH07DRAFT_1062737 [Mycena maculata]|uniref:Uncharacterized protein n=1 Tax=Mycena maculata TaxID=230809 RepID=A0AAD7IP08_9AGAR|nr:hypothetical protein DFH07DRAFT_1062737 [Mycena maculata]
MSFYGQFPSTAGPNDPTPAQTPIQLSPEHLYLCLPKLMYQCLLTLAYKIPLHAIITTAYLIWNAPPKRRRKAKNSTTYILRDKKVLSTKQKEVRKELMQKMKMELRNLTGMAQSPVDSGSDGEADTSASSTTPSSDTSASISAPNPTLSFNFNANSDVASNMKVFDRAADLIWREQKDPSSATFSLAHSDVQFPRADLVSFGKTNFRSWKRDWKAKNDTDAAARQAKQASKDRQGMRRREMKSKRLDAVKEYKKLHNKNPVCILESDFMTDEISGLDTDDDTKKAEHKKKLRDTAGLRTNDTQPVWEVVKPGYQSLECIEVKLELDRIVQMQKSNRKKAPRASAIRVSLGNTHSRIPSSTLWPFMVDDDWYKVHVEGNLDLKESMHMYEENPEGFGEDGYAGDTEEGV